MDREIDSYIRARKELLTETLDRLISERPEAFHRDLFDAARYSLLASGKRLRPLLTVATAEIFGIPLQPILIPACAIEMIHTYSLIHDDLPCMDDDDLRRGKPTLHKVYSEGHAVLTGDFLLTYAFEILSKSPGLSSLQRLRLITALSQSSGGDGMIGGQVVDLASEGKTIDWPTLEFMHLNKTGSLIAACLQFGGIIGKAKVKDMKHLIALGKNLGLAFQIVDDILDVTGSEATLGKPPGSDKEKEKTTAITFFGFQKAQEHAKNLLKEAKEHLHALSRPACTLETLIDKFVYRDN